MVCVARNRLITAGSRFCLGLLLCYGSACSVTALAERESPIAVNQCETAEDCPGVPCVNSMCVSTVGSFETLLFEVSPTVSASSDRYPGEQLFALGESLPTGGGRVELVLGDLAEITGRVRTALGPGCPTTFVDPKTQIRLALAEDDSVPARVTFVPTERAWGLSTASRTVLIDATLVDASRVGERPSSYPLGVSLPAGSFDIYVEPYAVVPSAVPAGSSTGTSNASSCALPPQLLRDQKFSGTKTDLNIVLPTPLHMDVQVEFPESAGNLEGWTVDMLEAVTSRVVSTRGRLVFQTVASGLSAYGAGLDYFPVPGDEDRGAGGELVRLSPPEGLVAPTLFFKRGGLELFFKGSVLINQLVELPKPVNLDARVIDATTSAPVPASVTFIASKLGKVPDGTLASFIRSAEAGDNGAFNVALLPGTYKVHVVPTRSSASGVPLAASEVTWQVAAEPSSQLGRTLALYPATTIRGRALVRPSDEGARGAIVAAEASSRGLETSVLARALDGLPLVPRTLRSTVQDASGSFVLNADAGAFDLSVRPPEGSGFAWFVMPELAVAPNVTDVDLGELWILPPIKLEVSALLEEHPSSRELLAGAYLRAYALLDENGGLTSDPAAARAAVPIAETRLDEGGRAAVLLPARLNEAPIQ